MSRWGSARLAVAVVITVVIAAGACAGPEKTDRWTAERSTDDAPAVEGMAAVCDEVEATALGSLAAESDLDATIDELSRLAAVLGATMALPAFEAARGTDDEATRRTAMTAAAAALDTAANDHCAVPMFTALYAATGWADCHGEVDIAAALYRPAPDLATRTCSAEGVPLFLPCWTIDDDGGHLPVDCHSGDVVRAVDGEWVPADGPRAPTPTVAPTTTSPADTSDPSPIDPAEATSTTSLPVVTPERSRACRAIEELFVGDDPLTGDDTDIARLVDATADLDSATTDLMADFEEASRGGWTLAEFEALVIEIDRATAATCGIPLISAAHLLRDGIDELPCWIETGVAYPSHEPVACPTG